MKNSLSLKQSTFVTIIIASAFLISVFTYLQLTKEADRTTGHQIRETYLRLLLAKEILESTLKSNPIGQDPTRLLVEQLNKLELEERVFEYTPYLLAKDGTVLYPPGKMNGDRMIDKRRIDEILMTYDLTGKWFRPLPASGRQEALDIYAPLFSSGHVVYFLKTTMTLDNLKTAFQRTYESVIIIFVTVVVVAFFVAYRVSTKIINPIKQLSACANEISRGNLNQEVIVETGDEIEELSRTFNDMAKQVSRMKILAEDANPLTHLPGNNVIASEITKRLELGAKLAVIHSDLDRFKIYNDTYGLKRGDEVIKMTAEVLQEAVREKGTPQDLVAHEGGDDFVIVTDPAHLEPIAAAIMQKFEARVGNHYRAEDRQRHFVLIKDRRSDDPQGTHKVEIPLMSVTLAAVTNEKKVYNSYSELAFDLVAVKKQAKNIRGNSFVVG